MNSADASQVHADCPIRKDTIGPTGPRGPGCRCPTSGWQLLPPTTPLRCLWGGFAPHNPKECAFSRCDESACPIHDESHQVFETTKKTAGRTDGRKERSVGGSDNQTFSVGRRVGGSDGRSVARTAGRSVAHSDGSVYRADSRTVCRLVGRSDSRAVGLAVGRSGGHEVFRRHLMA